MKKRASFLPYLLLNILVSAATVTLVLFFWGRAHPAAPQSALPTAALPTQGASQASPLSLPATTPSPTAELALSLEAVSGVSNLSLEYILIRNNGEQAVNLAGWQVVGPRDEVYTFPDLHLNRNGAVRLYSKTGTDSVIELFWGAEKALWRSGDELALQDALGTVYSTYQIP